MATRSTHWTLLIYLIACIPLLGCTSVYQVRGVEPKLAHDLLVDRIETQDPAGDAHLIRAVEARSVEPLELCDSGKQRKLQADGSCNMPPGPFKVGILEVDRHGSLNPKQRRQVFGMLDEEARSARDDGDNLVILVFIHGWHHGARVCDYNLACFRRLVGGMANVYGSGRADGKTPTRFVGIYFAWRGESIDKEGFNVLTIYNRKRRAEKIGRSGATDVLLDLDEQYRRLRSAAEEEKAKGTVLMVTAGHSLGGGMLLSALQSKLVGTVGGTEYIRSSHPRGEPTPGQRPPVGGYGDLSILINPAIQAAKFRAFANDLTEVVSDDRLAYAPGQTPTVLVLTSEADRATRRAFPASRWLLPHNWFRGAAQRKALGHYRPSRTHELTSTLDVSHEWKRRQRPCGCPFYVVGDALAQLPRPKDPASSFTTKLESVLGQLPLARGAPDGADASAPAYALERVFEPGWDDNAPFWVVRVNENIINSHSDIYNEALMRFLVVFLNTFFDAKGL